MKQVLGKLMDSFKSIVIPTKLWQRLGRVSSSTGLTRNLILRMGFCYEIESTKGLSEDSIKVEESTHSISKDVLLGDHSNLYFDLFEVWLNRNKEIAGDVVKKEELFKSLIISGGEHLCNKLLKDSGNKVLENLKNLVISNEDSPHA
tara:strand:- start:6889 stop:7329 length:441 start_codon:yes stop_codon:yes gene_type:complete